MEQFKLTSQKIKPKQNSTANVAPLCHFTFRKVLEAFAES